MWIEKSAVGGSFVLLAGCSYGAGGDFGAVGSGGAAVPGTSASGAPMATGDGGASSAPPPAPHCGDPGQARCAVGEPCRSDADCDSASCADTCQAPTHTDGRANGDETDVDCGGTAAPCAVAQHCKINADCTSQGCLPPVDDPVAPRPGTCATLPSCRQHAGGDTCGAGEVDDPAAQHEDCCLSLPVPKPNAPFRLDKYLITAGRMRSFLLDVGWDAQGWASTHHDVLPADWAWDDDLPATEEEAAHALVGTGNGCFSSGHGAPTFWLSPEHQQQWIGDEPRAFTQAELDTKSLNCAHRALFIAFCAWDGGGRIPERAEWAYAVRGDHLASEQNFPWGNDEDLFLDGKHASYNFNYGWPRDRQNVPLDPNDGQPIDRGWQVAAPGRFPLGVGPFGHADLAGLLETLVNDGGDNDSGSVRQGSFQEAGFHPDLPNGFNFTYGSQAGGGGGAINAHHYAVGARCARPL